MRKRTKEVMLWLTEDEYNTLKKNVGKTGLSMQAYLRKLIKGGQPKTLPPMEFFEILSELRRIGVNMNQIAIKANAIGFVDTNEYWSNMKALEKAISELKDEVRQ